MKIALLTPSKSAYSETFIANHIKHLPFEIVVIYGGVFPCESEGFSISKKEIFKLKVNNKIRKFSNKKLVSLKSYKLKKLLVGENVKHVFCEYLITGAEVTEVCRELQLPMSAIGLGYEISMYHILKQYKTKYKTFFDYASILFVVSNHMKKNMKELGCSESKIKYTPAGPNSQFFKVTPDVKNSQQFFALGRFVEKKAPHYTILAFYQVLQKYPKATLVIGGDGELLPMCKEIVNGLGISKSVSFVGRTTIEQQSKWLQSSLAFVQHSRVASTGDSEGTPVAILEASASALPVISTNHAGISDVVVHGETGLLSEENDVMAMTSHMIELLENPDKASEMGNAGRERIKQHFTLQKHIDILTEEIKSTITN